MTPYDTPSNPRKPWDQMDGEPDKWFARFLVFLGLGARRSIKLAQIAAESSQGKPAKARKQTAGSWTDACEKWTWHDRANKYDIHQAQKGLQSLEQDMEGQRRVTARNYRKLAELVERCLDAKNMEDVRLDLGKLMALCRKSGGIDAVVAAHKAQFGEKHKVEGTYMREIDWDAPFERDDKKTG